MTDEELRAWLATIKYQNDLILWVLSRANPRNKIPQPMPPTGVIRTDHPNGSIHVTPDV
jgi:hypothetical protein